MKKLFFSIIACFLLQSCDFMATMDIVNDSNEIAIIEIDYDVNEMTWSEAHGNYYKLLDYNPDSLVVIDRTELIYQFTIHPQGQFNMASSFNVDPPKIDHIQSFTILKPMSKKYESSEAIRDAFEKEASWYYVLRLK